jgi:hypothetical protein
MQVVLGARKAVYLLSFAKLEPVFKVAQKSVCRGQLMKITAADVALVV